MRQKRTGTLDTLHEALVAVERTWQQRANKLDLLRCSTNTALHWKARGSQETLRQAATYLRSLRRECRTACALHAELSGYARCLETQAEDAQADIRLPIPKHGIAVVRWRAEGECQVLPGMCAALTTLLEDYASREQSLFIAV